jgi:hypothetical protein|tara:strand:+ start:186 stop:395 length:210 start_codon:yes stop_codon:yes gene_type:complete
MFEWLKTDFPVVLRKALWAPIAATWNQVSEVVEADRLVEERDSVGGSKWPSSAADKERTRSVAMIPSES